MPASDQSGADGASSSPPRGGEVTRLYQEGVVKWELGGWGVFAVCKDLGANSGNPRDSGGVSLIDR